MTKTSFQAFAPVASRWLAWQCKMISDVKIGAVFVHTSSSENELEMLASWPQDTFNSMTGKLHELALSVIDNQETVPSKINCSLGSANTVCDVTTLPLRYGNEIVGAVIFLQSVRSQEQKKAVYQLFQWGCAWLESTLSSAYEEQNQLDPLVTSLSKLALQDSPIAVTGHQICNLLIQQLECKRVSIGIMKGLQVYTLALSNQLRFDSRSSHLREMETAMEEAIDQKQTVVYPQPEDALSLVTHKHTKASALHEDAAILSIPLVDGENIIGAVLLLRQSNKPFTKQEVEVLQFAIELLGPIVALKLRDEHSLTTTFFQATAKIFRPLFGARNLPLKISALVFVALFTTLSLIKTEHYTYAKSTLEASIQQVIVAPQDGFIKSAEVRAGDKVEMGQTLVLLNDHDLKLEHEKLLTKRNKTTKEYQEALALRQRAKISIFLAQIAQVDAQISLIEQRLKRIQLKAPFAGIVVSGDLSHSLGAPIQKGDPLFEIAPLGNYRVALSVDDHDVSKLKIGQTGSLRLVGLPYEQLSLVISRITPIAAAHQGGNYFHVEATISDIQGSHLRPGMQGITKIEVGNESILWVWTHALIERLRLWLWSIGF